MKIFATILALVCLSFVSAPLEARCHKSLSVSVGGCGGCGPCYGPVYAQPVYVQPVYAQPVYAQPVYPVYAPAPCAQPYYVYPAQPACVNNVTFGIGW